MTETTTVTPAAVSLNIDGRSLEVPKGTTILETAAQNDIHIPTLCYLKKLLPIGSCRVCSVEVEGVEGPVMSCVTPVAEGMSVTTQSDALSLMRKQMMQFILVNHPLDCPVCERSGECSLQDRTYEFGASDQVFFTTDHEKVAVKDWGVIRYDRNLCIMCERCVKICREIQGCNELVIDGSGLEAKINTADGEPLDCDFCGQCLSVCPVGALNSGVVLPVRAWEVTKTESICPHCAVGCSYNIEVKKGQIARITSDDDMGINNGNLCARGRFGFEAFQSDGRIKTPLTRDGVKLDPATWDIALDKVATRLREICNKYGAQSVAVITSERVTNEDAYMIQKVFRTGFGVNRLETLSNMRAPALNSGVFDQFGPLAPINGYEEIAVAGSFVFFGCDASNENPVIANMIRVAMRDNGTNLYVANARNAEFFPDPKIRVRYNYGSETALLAALLRKLTGKVGIDDPNGFAAFAGDANMVDVMKATGISIDGIEEFAEAIAKDGSPLFFIGKEIHDHPNSLNIMNALTNLAGLLGGKTLLYREFSNSQGTNDMGMSPANFPGYMKVDDSRAVSHYSKEWGCDLPAFSNNNGDIFRDLHDGKLKAVVLLGVDPITHYPNGKFVREAIGCAEFVVTCDSFISDTTLLADVVLPTCVLPERDGTYTNNEGRPQVIRKAVDPLCESKPEWEIFRDIGKLAGLKLESNSASDVAEEIARTVRGYAGLTHSRLAWGEDLATYSGKEGSAAGLKFDPSISSAPAAGDGQLLLLTGTTVFHLDSLSRHSAALNGIEPRTFIEISQDDATALGLENGDEAEVTSELGSVDASVIVTGKSPNGVAFMTKCFENAAALKLIKSDGVTTVKVSKVEK